MSEDTPLWAEDEVTPYDDLAELPMQEMVEWDRAAPVEVE